MFKFDRKGYTIWQNSAANPYTALMVPVEETLHISLRTCTVRLINDRIDQEKIDNIYFLEKVVPEMAAVEEAVVGGLVHRLLLRFLNMKAKNVDASWVAKDLDTKMLFKAAIHAIKSCNTENVVPRLRFSFYEYII